MNIDVVRMVCRILSVPSCTKHKVRCRKILIQIIQRKLELGEHCTPMLLLFLFFFFYLKFLLYQTVSKQIRHKYWFTISGQVRGQGWGRGGGGGQWLIQKTFTGDDLLFLRCQHSKDKRI